MDKSVGFYYIKDSSHKKQNKIDFLVYVKIGDGGYDYYLISVFLDNNLIEYDITKISNIFDYAQKNNIKLDKMKDNLNENLYKFLLKTLWDYIYMNNYTIFDLKKLGFNVEEDNDNQKIKIDKKFI